MLHIIAPFLQAVPINPELDGKCHFLNVASFTSAIDHVFLHIFRYALVSYRNNAMGTPRNNKLKILDANFDGGLVA